MDIEQKVFLGEDEEGKEEQIVLTTGLKTNAELAAWFGVKENSFRNSKKQKLKILVEYAEFEEVKTKINILKVLKPVYIKRTSKNYKLILSKVDEEWGEVNTGTRVSNSIYSKYVNELTISKNTTYRYTLEGRTELFGKPSTGQKGAIGCCHYVFAKVADDGKVVNLTKEETKIKDRLLKKYFGDINEKVIVVKSLLKEGKIKEEDFYSTLEEISNLDKSYTLFMAEFAKEIKGYPIRATAVDRFAW